MKYLKKFNGEVQNFKNNVDIHHTSIKEICNINLPDPQHGNVKLNVFPFENKGGYISLPEGYLR